MFNLIDLFSGVGGLAQGFKETKQLADSVNKARKLSDTPANQLTPKMLATQIKKILSDKCDVKILNEKQICEKKNEWVTSCRTRK